MNVTLYCPGPSLAKIGRGAPSATPSLTVGVNRAPIFVPCDVWVAGDPPLIQQTHENVIGTPLLVTSVDGKHVVDTFERDFGKTLWRGQSLCWSGMLEFCPHAFNWVMFSATGALVYCAFAGGTHIDVYGADWSGTLDFDGAAAGKNRSQERWQLERQIWANVVAWLGDRGVEVIRHTQP